MSDYRPLTGSCNCGRYNYVVFLPKDSRARRAARVHFGTGVEDRRSQASLLSAWLRIPLDWYQSATVSFFDDERHDLIQRTFNPLHQPRCQRKFCGFCGTHISYWTEDPEIEQDYIHVTLGSLRSGDLEALADMEMLPEDLEEEVVDTSNTQTTSDFAVAPHGDNTLNQTHDDNVTRSSRQGVSGNISWFEDILEGSRLGSHSKSRRGHGTSADGTTTVQWEISEYVEGGDQDSDAATTRSKRKAVDITEDDTVMQQ